MGGALVKEERARGGRAVIAYARRVRGIRLEKIKGIRLENTKGDTARELKRGGAWKETDRSGLFTDLFSHISSSVS